MYLSSRPLASGILGLQSILFSLGCLCVFSVKKQTTLAESKVWIKIRLYLSLPVQRGNFCLLIVREHRGSLGMSSVFAG